MSILFTIFFVILMFKLTGLFFRICGAILGAVFSFIGFAVIGMLLVAALGLAVNALPLFLLLGAGATAIAASKR